MTSKGKRKALDLPVPLGQVTLFQEYADQADRVREQSEALRLARTIALACMPKRRTKDRDLVRVIRMGKHTWVKVTYSASADSELPFGDDRFVLAGIIHLALENRTPLVDFGSAGTLLKMFDIDRGKRAYVLLRQRFERLAGLSISIKLAASREALDDPSAEMRIKREFLFADSSLPSRKALQDGTARQMELFSLVEVEDVPRYGVLLSPQIWSFVSDKSQQFLVPIYLLKHFVNNPTGWDYLMFLVHRCGAAQTSSKVPHDALMHLFKDSEDEPDRKAIDRLKRVHKQVMYLTEGKLNASLEEDGYFPNEGRGRPRKRWCLKVAPSESLLPVRPTLKVIER